MKRYITLGLCLLSLSYIFAAPKWIKSGTKSIVHLYAPQQKGDTLTAYSFFLNETGLLVVPLSVIQNAKEAWITDVSDKSYRISRIKGFNTTYNVAVLQAEMGKKKSVCMPVVDSTQPIGTQVYLMPNGTLDEITQVEKAGNYDYFTLKSAANPQLAGNPIINETGQVVGILQTPVLVARAPNYGLDIRYIHGLSIRPIDANNSDLRNCGIQKSLPEDEKQAISFLYLVSATDNPLKEKYIDDFIQAFPNTVTGYIQKAEWLSNNQRYAEAETTYEQGLKQVTEHSDEIYYSRSRISYLVNIQPNGAGTDLWRLEHALEDISKAQSISPQPIYTLQEANVLFSLKRYEEAFLKYMETTQTNMRSAEIFMYAWQCKKNLGATNEELLALNDSAVACFTKPYPKENATYLFLRSNVLTEMGRLREAISDLNDYEHLMQDALSAEFYYKREQLEVRSRMFAPAINDIQKAISLAPKEPLYYSESAAIFIRINDMESAIRECNKAIAADPKFPDAYRLLGICLREKGDKDGARLQLQKAISLGDTLAKDILEKLE